MAVKFSLGRHAQAEQRYWTGKNPRGRRSKVAAGTMIYLTDFEATSAGPGASRRESEPGQVRTMDEDEDSKEEETGSKLRMTRHHLRLLVMKKTCVLSVQCSIPITRSYLDPMCDLCSVDLW